MVSIDHFQGHGANLHIRLLQTGSLAFVRPTPDLPPSYASVMTVQETSTPAWVPRTVDPGEDKFQDPPPYSVVIASTNMQEQNTEIPSEWHAPSTAPVKKDVAVASVTSGSNSASHTSRTCPHAR